MTRLVVRGSRSKRAEPPLLTIALLGLAGGALAGFLIGEFYGPAALRAIQPTPTRKRGPRSLAEMVNDAQEALHADAGLATLDLSVLPVGRRAVELHGWVTDRRQRAQAQRLVTLALGESTVVNCLLVHGEDDEAPDLDVISA